MISGEKMLFICDNVFVDDILYIDSLMIIATIDYILWFQYKAFPTIINHSVLLF